MATEKTRLLPSKLERGLSAFSNTAKEKTKDCIIVIKKHSPVGANSHDNEDYFGLTLDELLPYQNDPLWLSVRRAIMILFWAGLIVMLTLTFMISAVEYDQRCKGKGSRAMLTSTVPVALDLAAPIFGTRNTVLNP